MRGEMNICPICGSNDEVVTRMDGSMWGDYGGPEYVGHIVGSGGSTRLYYCKRCQADFDVKVEYVQYTFVPEGRKHL